MQALPCSLATTYGISVDFFSSSYLDVSVHSVRHHLPIYSGAVTLAGGFPHSDMSGSKLICQLPEPFRRLSRPSSPVIAKASTICTYSLDPITLKPKPFLNLDFLMHETSVIVFLKQLFLICKVVQIKMVFISLTFISRTFIPETHAKQNVRFCNQSISFRLK